MLKVAMPRHSSDAASRGAGRGAFEDNEDERPPRRLSKEEVVALVAREPALSPWRVVLAQVALGVVVAAIAWGIGGRASAVSALYGAAAVAIPGAIVARSATSRLTTASPMLSTASLLSAGLMKIIVSVVMLALAPRIVAGLVWPAMLAALFVTMQTYWFALLWRGRTQ